ncbi:MAG: phosphoglycerate dehydrogenase [Desulfobacteraceae bacterium]|nr:phosphoglycerate dehydrogenase [Desulfobacteraceae bacterium]
MKVLVSDNLGEAGIRTLETAGFEVDVKTGLSPEELKSIIFPYHALVIRSATRVTADLLEAAENLRVVGRAGIGLDNVDIKAATRKGVVVMNTPGGNVITTAEHTLALMLSLTRNIPQGTASLKAGRWEKKKLMGREIYDKTLGVIGLGKIGSVVADRARGLKMRVKVYDPVVQPEAIEKQGFECVSLEKLYSDSDYISVHVPKSKETTGMINREAISKMKDGVMIVNCARGGIVDEDALYEAINSGKVAGAALDVFSKEPPPEDFSLFGLENLVATPHLGASTYEAQTNVAVAVAEQIIEYLKNNNLVNSVNVASISGRAIEQLGPFIELAEKMGRLQAQFLTGQFREINIQYNGDFFGYDLMPVTSAFIKGLLAPRLGDEVNAVNAHYLAKELGIRVTESNAAEATEFLHLISTKVIGTEKTSMVAGTVFGKSDPRIVRLDDFRIEIIPQGYLALIHNRDEPGAIGSIGMALGEHNINISRMQVGQEVDGEHNIILLRTDTPIPDNVAEALRGLPKVESVNTLEL